MNKLKILFLLVIFSIISTTLHFNIALFKVETGIVSAADKVKDVVCGMEIDKNPAFSEKIENKEFFFCSNTCKALFNNNAGKFTCLCFVGMEEGDDPCECKHCSGKGGRCDCSDDSDDSDDYDHGGHDHSDNEHHH